jgi:hypothetical protein
MHDRRPAPLVRTILSFMAPRRSRAAGAPGAEPDVRMSDGLERELVEREIRRQRGIW